MKKICSILLLIISSGCSKEFDRAAPYKDITIVQAVLNAADTAHYIGIKKAFLDNDKDARDIAKESDSNFYKSLSVILVESDAENITAEIETELVDLNNEGYPKEEGIFYTQPNYAYKFKYPLDITKNYRLLVTNLLTGRIDSSEKIDIVDATASTDRASEYGLISFASTDEEAIFMIKGTCPRNALMVAGFLKINYVDSNVVTGVRERGSVLISLGDTVVKEGRAFTLKVGTIDILNSMAVNIGDAPTDIVRLMSRCEVWYFAAGKELFYYSEFRDKDKFIRSDMSNPVYTNMIGGNAYGVICSGTTRGNAYAFVDTYTMQTIREYEFTKSLRFIGWTKY